MTEFIENLTAVLALVAAAGAVCLVAARVVGGSVPAAARVGGRLVARRTEVTLAVAGVSLLGSLYFSEVADYVPCRLCWFQRIAMYPIALVALVAVVRRDRGARWYMVPMAIVGALISTYHLLIEWSVLNDSGSCSAFGTPCDVTWFKSFGFVSLAAMALCGFAMIVAVNTISFDTVSSETAGSGRHDPVRDATVKTGTS